MAEINCYRDRFDCSSFRADRLSADDFARFRVTTVLGGELNLPGLGGHDWYAGGRRTEHCRITAVHYRFGLYNSTR